MMGKYTRIIGIVISAMFFILGGCVLFVPNFSSIPKEFRPIFSVFLFLYGGYRMVRYIYKKRDNNEEE